MHPAGERDQQQRAVKQPVHGFGGKGFQRTFRMQGGGFGLAQRPENAAEGDEKDQDARCLVDREQERRALDIGLRAGDFRIIQGMGHVIGDKAKGDHCQDQEGGEPVKAHADRAIACRCIGKCHCLLRCRLRGG